MYKRQGVVALNLSGEVVCHLRESVAFDLDDDAYLQKIGRSVEEMCIRDRMMTLWRRLWV